jgi:hypothetical protein
MLGTVAAGPRSAEDGERGAGSTGRLGVGWGTGEAGALEAAAGGGGAGGDAGGGAAAMTGPDGGTGAGAAMIGPDGGTGAGAAMTGPDAGAGGDGRASGRSSTPGTGRAMADPEGEAGDGGLAGGAVVTPLDAVPGDPPGGLRWLSVSFESGGGDRRGSSGFDGGLGTSAGGDAIRSW